MVGLRIDGRGCPRDFKGPHRPVRSAQCAVSPPCMPPYLSSHRWRTVGTGRCPVSARMTRYSLSTAWAPRSSVPGGCLRSTWWPTRGRPAYRCAFDTMCKCVSGRVHWGFGGVHPCEHAGVHSTPCVIVSVSVSVSASVSVIVSVCLGVRPSRDLSHHALAVRRRQEVRGVGLPMGELLHRRRGPCTQTPNKPHTLTCIGARGRIMGG
jgi:hypothetical protein